MNNTLNIKRFGLVLRKDLMENWKRYMLLFLTMLGIMAIVLIWQSLEYYSFVKRHGSNYINLNNNLLTTLSLMFGAFGLLFASIFMNPMNSKIKRVSYLVNPSSNLEKYLSRWIIITVGYIIAFFAALWVAEILRVGICSARYPDMEINFLDFNKLVHTGDDWNIKQKYALEKPVFIIGISLYFLLQSLFILGSTFWEKATFIKTFTAGIIIVLAYILLCRWAILLSYGGFEGFGNVFQSFEALDKKEIDQEKAITIIASFISVFTITNWILAYFRFCESEITKRL